MVGLGGLALHLNDVKNTIRDYFDDLINIGVTGTASNYLAQIVVKLVACVS